MKVPAFSVMICTKNRLSELRNTLSLIGYLLENPTVECRIIDDGSTDGTFSYLQEHYPHILVQRNETSKGLIFCRNKMLNETNALYAISLDDDAHFLSEDPLQPIKQHFERNPDCGVLAMRVFWGLQQPAVLHTIDLPQRVQSFVGCAHVWRMEAWRAIPDYPAWFVFYGEEDFAAFQLFSKGLQVHYVPALLVMHRVDVRARRSNSDYTVRQRRSLRAGWYLFFLFLPLNVIPRKLVSSIWAQFKNKVLTGDWRVLRAMGLAFLDLIRSLPRLIKHSNRLSRAGYEEFKSLPPTKIYWQPES